MWFNKTKQTKKKDSASKLYSQSLKRFIKINRAVVEWIQVVQNSNLKSQRDNGEQIYKRFL